MANYVLPPNAYLKDLFVELPSGIVIKGAPGIGATTLELMFSKRHVVLISPLVSILKSKQHSKILTFFGGIEAKETIVEEYFASVSSSEFVKVHTTAESLPTLLYIIKKLGRELPKSFHLILDEYDLMLLQTDFRDKLPIAFDFYKKVPKESRTCVSATRGIFSDPELKTEPVHHIFLETLQPRNVDLRMTDDTISVALEVATATQGQVCIFVDSLAWINTFISRLGSKDVAIYCGANSKDKAGEFYSEYTAEPTAKFCFFTSAYFVGCDLLIKPTLITVSDPELPERRGLTKAQLVQIQGRFRNGVNQDVIVSSVPSIIQTPTTSAKLLNEATRNLKASIAFLKKASPALKTKYLKMIEDIGGEKLYIRINMDGKVVINYSLIDSILLREYDNSALYLEEGGLKEYLEGELGYSVVITDHYTGSKTKIIRPVRARSEEASKKALDLIRDFTIKHLNDAGTFGIFNRETFQAVIGNNSGIVRELLEIYALKPDLTWFESCKGDISILKKEVNRSLILSDPEFRTIIEKHFPVGLRIKIPDLYEVVQKVNTSIGIPIGKLTKKTCRKHLGLFCQFKNANLGPKRQKGVEITGY